MEKINEAERILKALKDKYSDKEYKEAMEQEEKLIDDKMTEKKDQKKKE